MPGGPDCRAGVSRPEHPLAVVSRGQPGVLRHLYRNQRCRRHRRRPDLDQDFRCATSLTRLLSLAAVHPSVVAVARGNCVYLCWAHQVSHLPTMPGVPLNMFARHYFRARSAHSPAPSLPRSLRRPLSFRRRRRRWRDCGQPEGPFRGEHSRRDPGRAPRRRGHDGKRQRRGASKAVLVLAALILSGSFANAAQVHSLNHALVASAVLFPLRCDHCQTCVHG